MSALVRRHILTLLLLVVGMSWFVGELGQSMTPQGKENAGWDSAAPTGTGSGKKIHTACHPGGFTRKR